MKNKIFIFVWLLFGCFAGKAQSDLVNTYTVDWDSPSKNASGAMPIGNGEVGANVWMEDHGNLLFYLSRTDAWSENSSLYKLGRIRVSLYPFLSDDQTHFRQTLNLKEGKVEIEMRNQTEQISLDFLIDSESPVVYLRGKSTYPVQVTVSSEVWRTQTRILPVAERHFALSKCPFDSLAMEYPDQVADVKDRLVVYHRNEHSIYPFTIKHQGVADDENSEKDPLMGRTMGYNLSGDGFVKIAPAILSSEKKVTDFCLKVVAYTAQTPCDQEWMDQAEQILEQAPPFEKAAYRTANWWENYWDKSYVVIQTPDKTLGEKITQAYILQNWMSACAGRGNYPIKFNGSIFTVDPEYTDLSKAYNPDYRLWGPDYWWQNTRLIYHPMLKSGDHDMMQVLFRHYFSNLPMMKRNAEVLWGASGAVNPETSTIFGTFVNHDYGWDTREKKTEIIENPYVRYYWSSGLEIVALMIDYYQYTQNKSFAKDTLVPMAHEILEFYHSYFPRDEHGKIRITPTHSLEMYWDHVYNDLPNVAGLHYVVSHLLRLPEDCSTKEENTFWVHMLSLLPDVPSRTQDGLRLFSPAESYEADKKTNMENPELYAIFPFSLCNIASPDLQKGRETYHKRVIRHVHGWAQDGQQAARLGLTEEAKANLVAKLEYICPNHRFPVIWGPNFDWTPDQDHGSNLLMTLQDMIMQSYGKSVYLLPAFPEDWDVSFKLYIPGNNWISGEYKDQSWKRKPTMRNRSSQKIVITKK